MSRQPVTTDDLRETQCSGRRSFGSSGGLSRGSIEQSSRPFREVVALLDSPVGGVWTVAWILKENEMAAVLALPGPERYAHSIKKIADEGQVWSLWQEGWAHASDDGGLE